MTVRLTRAGPLLCAAVLVGAPQVAIGQTVSSATLIAEFKAMCMATNSSKDPALAEAERQHWTNAPSKTFAKGNEIFIEARSSGDQLLIVSEYPGDMVAADGKSRIPAHYRTCEVFATVDDPKAVIAFAEAVVGQLRPYSADKYGRQWFYSLTDAGVRALSSNRDGVEAGRAARFRELMVSDTQTPRTGGNTALSYTVGLIP